MSALAHSSQRADGIKRIQEAAARAVFGSSLVMNVHRAIVVEAIVAEALEPEWTLCSQDYQAWDFEHADGTLLEVKQSAARQSWTEQGAKPSRANFDIKLRQGRYAGAGWHSADQPKRYADIYVFAHHAIFDDGADHRDPEQWTFYVAPTVALPDQATISIGRLRTLAPSCLFADLRTLVREVASRLRG